jgi:hypothetical protein
MGRIGFVAGIVAAVASVVVAAPAVAAPVGYSVEITAHTDFTTPDASTFESNLTGCEDGTVVTGPPRGSFTPWGGTFIGTKEFTCTGGESGFTIRLTARFGGGGSTGTWTLADAWGDLAGAKGSGSLVGIPTSDTSIDDIYTGTFR